MQAIEASRRAAKEASWVLPSELARRIAADAGDAAHLAEFKNLIVANIAKLGEVVELVEKAFTGMATTLKDEPLVKW
jgi:hypothetical protein